MEYQDGQPVDDHLYALLPGAARCRLHRYHSPRPLRLVVHHILPKYLGGTDDPGNLAVVCDTGHYNTHALLDHLAEHGALPPAHGTRAERALAREGHTRRAT